MLVAKNIEAAMARRGLDRAEVNRRARLNQTGVNDILSGKSRDPRIGTLRRIAEDALGIPVIALFREPCVDPVEQEMFEIFSLLPSSEKRRFLRIVQAMRDSGPGSENSAEAPPASD